ncbi:Aste57867_23950 [Aphanomyces stellatus]|uniref:Aste57867_23950 protein n=1 Tax=Aphanomyces stellatus TaxID=120398 RepID=A0A485LQX9_9STRA|nr:hypothetical protein As57867_023877 [Aphanomyces stellatus]VFU00593.1 Aste57867_23950 [Aphanomyces stellatus]
MHDIPPNTSATNQLRLLVLAAEKKRRCHRRQHPSKASPLEPIITHGSLDPTLSHGAASSRLPLHMATIRKRMQEPTSLQMQVDDFIESAGEGLEDRVELYIRAGLPIDRTHTVLGYTALHAAANQPDGRVMARLLRAGADVNAEAKPTRSTALHAAVLYGNQAGVDKLLQHRAARSVCALGNIRPTDVASEYNRDEIQTMLQGPPPPPHAPTCNLVEPYSLHIAWVVKPTAIRAHRSRHEAQDDGGMEGGRGGSQLYPPAIQQFRVQWRMWCASDVHHSVCTGQAYLVDGLVPATMYEITVQAANAAGWSAASAPLVAKTAETVPTAPKAPRITIVSDRSITMQLTLPESNGPALETLAVFVQKTGPINLSDTHGMVTLLDVKAVETAWVRAWTGDASSTELSSVQDDASMREYTVTGLNAGHVYFFRLQAANALGWSDMGDISDGICTNGTTPQHRLSLSLILQRRQDAPKIVHKSGTSLGLSWPKPYSTYDIDVYELQYKLVGGGNDWTTASSRVRVHNFNVERLLPATAYVFRVRPHFVNVPPGVAEWDDPANCAVSPIYQTDGPSDSESDSGPCVCVWSDCAVPDGPDDVEMLARTQSALDLRWKFPRCNGHVVLFYELAHQIMRECKTSLDGLSSAAIDPHAPWTTVSNAIPVDRSAGFRVDGLRHGTPYRFRLRARNALGWSEPGPPSGAFFTHAFLPPTPPTSTSKTHYSLDLRWEDDPTDVNSAADQKTFFELHMCRLKTYCPHDAIPTIEQEAWDVVHAKCAARACVVSNLSALTWYCFRVRSWIRHRGWTEFSDASVPIQTLRRM